MIIKLAVLSQTEPLNTHYTLVRSTRHLHSHRRILLEIRKSNFSSLPVPVAPRSKAWVWGLSLAGIPGSNVADGMDVCPLWLLCVVRWRSLRSSDHSFREILPRVVCLSVCRVCVCVRACVVCMCHWVWSGATISPCSCIEYGPGSSVGIATGYGLDGPGSNPGGGEIFRTCPDRPWGPPSLL